MISTTGRGQLDKRKLSLFIKQRFPKTLRAKYNPSTEYYSRTGKRYSGHSIKVKDVKTGEVLFGHDSAPPPTRGGAPNYWIAKKLMNRMNKE